MTYKNKYDTSVSYLNGLGVAFADKNVNDIKYGIEIIKTSYIEEKAHIEKTCIPHLENRKIRF